MSVEITAAIIGGAISGAVVLVGILLAEYLARRRERDHQLRSAVRRLVLKVPEALTYAGPFPPDDRRLDYGSPGRVAFFDMNEDLAEIDLLSRRRGGKEMAQVREQVTDLSARLLAVQLRLGRDITLSMEEIWAITAKGSPLVNTVFGERQVNDELTRHYVEHGAGD